MPNKTDNQFFIKLKSHELKKSQVKEFYEFIIKNIPNGVTSSVQLEHPTNGLESVRLIHRKCQSGEHEYEIPLTRNLTASEFRKLDLIFDKFFDKDQILEASNNEILTRHQLPYGENVILPESYNILCDTMAKYQHESWCDIKRKDGWRFSTEFNEKEKTNPLLRAWQDIPKDYKKVDKKLPKQLFLELEKMGFAIVSKDSLRRLLKNQK
jgi:RyR domain